MRVSRQEEHGRWLPAETMPEPFGVLWGRLWHARRRDGDRKWLALFTSWRDASAIQQEARAPLFDERRAVESAARNLAEYLAITSYEDFDSHTAEALLHRAWSELDDAIRAANSQGRPA